MRCLLVMDYNKRCSKYRDGAYGPVGVFEVEPMLILWQAFWWEVHNVAYNGKTFWTRWEIGLFLHLVPLE
jgi:hypothetical protein